MATELWSPWGGLTGWRSRRADGYSIYGVLDGVNVYYCSDDQRTVDRAFYRACRRTVLRRIMPFLAAPARQLCIIIHEIDPSHGLDWVE